MAGQTYPEPSPYDRLILDQRVRFVGDAVAIIAGETEAAVDHAMRLIKVKYQVLEPVLDMHDSKDGKILVHPEDNWKALCNVGADNKRNLCASGGETHGDLEAAFAGCSHIVEKTYHTKANQQAMMETFRAFTYMDVYGRLNVVASTRSLSMCVVSWLMHWMYQNQGFALSTKDRWRFWCKADRSSRSLSGDRYYEDRKTG